MQDQAIITSTIFWVFAIMAVTSAIGLVRHKSVVYAALFLIVVFLSNAAFYVLNNADFLAIAQVLVYAVGLTIVMLFAIMFTGEKAFLKDSHPISERTKAAYAVIVMFAAALFARALQDPIPLPVKNASDAWVLQNAPNQELIAQIAKEGTAKALAYGPSGLNGLFNTFSLPFELASILLTVAMLGAILMAKKSLLEEQTSGSVKLPLDLASRPMPEAQVDLDKHLEAGKPSAAAKEEVLTGAQ